MSRKAIAKIRLFVDVPLVLNQEFNLSEMQAHYLCHVMRLPLGSEVSCFNGQDGEWRCQITDANKKSCTLTALEQTKPQISVPDVWLMFAPLKKDCTDFVIAKAVELGAARIIPTITRFTQNGAVRIDRFALQAAEAAEQCRRLDVPIIEKPQSLSVLLDNWPQNRTLFFMDESGNGKPAAEVFGQYRGQPAAILVGPEGGFAAEELQMLRQQPFAAAVSLGPRILRAETAVAAALAVWQAAAGDWK